MGHELLGTLDSFWGSFSWIKMTLHEGSGLLILKNSLIVLAINLSFPLFCFSTTAATTVRSAVRRLREMAEV